MSIKGIKYPNDITWVIFGRLTVMEKAGVKNQGKKGSKSLWLCKCDCGNEKIVLRNSLVSGNTHSCGCLEKETKETIHLKHGMAKTRIWSIWVNMKDRCERKSNKSFMYYGGKGIKVCDEWKKDFKSFYNWSMLNGYTDELTIDRINCQGDYEPNNCRWETMKKQVRNRSITKKAKYKGTIISIGEIAELEGINYQKAYEKYGRNKFERCEKPQEVSH